MNINTNMDKNQKKSKKNRTININRNRYRNNIINLDKIYKHISLGRNQKPFK